MNKIPKKIIRNFSIFLLIYLTLFLLGIITKFFIVPWVFSILVLFYGGYVAIFVVAVCLGIYAANNYKRRWFLPVVGILAYFCLFQIALFTFNTFYIPPVNAESRQEYAANVVIIILLAMIVSMLSFAIKLLLKLKSSVVIKAFLITAVTVAVVIPVGIFLNKRYCPTYYKYPDFFITGNFRSTVQQFFGEFDINSDSMCAYYAYTDEHGNCWYYTMYHEDGVIKTICLEIH